MNEKGKIMPLRDAKPLEDGESAIVFVKGYDEMSPAMRGRLQLNVARMLYKPDPERMRESLKELCNK